MRDPGAVAGVVLGSAAPGRESTWAARDSGGAPRDVVVVPLSPDPDVRGAALNALAGLRGPGLGHRQEVVEITACRVGVAIVAAPIAGRSLGSHSSGGRARRLSVAQIATLGRPLARELAALHAEGLAFGAVDLRDEVFVDEAGRPTLAVEQFALRVIAGTCGAPEDDMRALVGLLRRLARPEDSRARLRFDQSLLAPDCAALAVALARVARPVSFRAMPRSSGWRVRGAPSSDGAGARHRLDSRWPLRVPLDRFRPMFGPGALAVAVVGVALIGWTSVHSESEAPTPAVATVVPDWRAVIDELDARRAAVFAGGAVIDDVDAAGSAAYAEDAERWKALQNKGLRAAAFEPAVTDVRVTSATADRVELLVTDSLPAYQLIDASNAVVASMPERGSVTWAITLQAAPGESTPWRFVSVARS